MRLTLTVKPDAVYLGKERLSDELVPQVALHSTVIDKSHPERLVIDFRGTLKTKGIWRMPLSILNKLY